MRERETKFLKGKTCSEKRMVSSHCKMTRDENREGNRAKHEVQKGTWPLRIKTVSVLSRMSCFKLQAFNLTSK
jgi:hypothetical protein